MNKTNSVDALPAQQTTDVSVQTTAAQFIPTQFTGDVEVNVDAKALVEANRSSLNLSLEYHSFEMGVSIRGLFLGVMPYRCVDQNTGEENILTGAVWVDQDQNVKINCAAKFVSTVSQWPCKTAFEATFRKTKKTSNGGNMQLFDVRKLDYSA